MKMTARASCGLVFACPADLPSAKTVAIQSGYDFLCIPIVHPRYRIPEKSGDLPEKSGDGPIVRNHAHTRYP
jgi:hypothetical protein